MTTHRHETPREWVDALQHMGRKVVAHTGYWMAQCPAHDDSNPSLRIREGLDGEAGIECYAGCNFVDILKAVGFHGNARSGAQRPVSAVSRPQTPQTPPKAKEPPKPRSLPNGPRDTAYYYRDAASEVVFAVIRTERDDGKTFSQWTPDSNGQWLPVAPHGQRPMFCLPDIGTSGSMGSVGIVEGEKCAEALRAAWPKKPVTTWAGGTNAWQLTDWTPLAGREVSLIADGDAPGHKAMQSLAEHLHGLGCKVRLCLPPPEWDNDIADWLDQGKAYAAKVLSEHLQSYQPPLPPPEAAHEEPDIDPSPDDIRDNSYYRLLGLEHLNLIFRLKKEGQDYIVARNRITKYEELRSLAPDTFWHSVSTWDALTPMVCRQIGGQLIDAASNLAQIDRSTFVERGAIRLPDGKVAYHLGDRLLAEGREMDLNTDTSHVWLSGPPLDLGSPARLDRAGDIARSVMRYRWASPDDGRRFLGWIVAAIIGGALEWRPHLWLTAPATTGKTWLFDNVLKPLMGGLMEVIANATAASLARYTGNSSLPIGIDEAEPSSEWVIGLLDELRVASSAVGVRIRSDAHGGVVKHSARFSAILSSTVAPNLAKADASRITEIGLSMASVQDWPSVRLAITNAMKHADAVRYKIIRDAQQIADEVRSLALEMQGLGMDSREALASAAFTVGWRWWGLDQREVMAQPETSERTDAADALLEILALRYNAPGGYSISVAQMLTQTVHDEALKDLYGIRRVGSEIWLAEQHHGLRQAMTRSKWASADLRKLLLQLEGVSTLKNAVHFGGLKARALVIPAETLEAIGVDLGEMQEELHE